MSKINFLITVLVLISFTSQAKKVKFAVDMQNETINPGGVHVVGDFTEAAGLGTNFAYLAPMLQEGSTSIYSIVVDIPAFQKYEYKFANGNLFYDVEFVPVESRVGYDFIDNRWIYVDSTANDTTFIGALLFGGNAPDNMYMARLIVDMQNESISTAGVHIGGTFNNWGATKTQIISLQNNSVYEGLVFIPQGTSHEYKFFNGATITEEESVPPGCAVNGNRALELSTDSVFDLVCFSFCTNCTITNIKSLTQNLAVTISPNPSTDRITVKWNNNSDFTSAVLKDITGKTIQLYDNITSTELEVEKANFNAGMYFLNLKGKESITYKLIFE